MVSASSTVHEAVSAIVDRRDLQRTEASVLQRMFGLPPAPTTIDRFELRGVLGSGAMGKVYAAHDPELDRPVALKVMLDDTRAGSEAERRTQDLLKEARAAAQLNHPNVVDVFAVGMDDGEVYIAMEMIDGSSLRAWGAEAQRSVEEVLEVFVAAGRGLAAAHEVGIIHRDFKPDNVLVGADGRVKVADFGLAVAAAVSQSVTISGTLSAEPSTSRRHAGTPGYMAPELLIGGRAGAQSDQFSFAVSLAEILTGQRVRDPKRLPDKELPRRVLDVLRRGLATEPEARFPSMHALVQALVGRRRQHLMLGLGF
ncbi:MAG: serine/threonine-protein kinase, partial [Myxococcota bacterium]